MEIILQPIAIITNNRKLLIDDNWGNIVSIITLLPHIPSEAFENIESFSHLEIIYYFHRVEEEKIIYSGRPRENPLFPKMGIFGQRKKERPNRIGLCTVELLEHSGRAIKVRSLDAIDETPVLDIKPVFKEFQVNKTICQPGWVSEMMKDYWKY